MKKLILFTLLSVLSFVGFSQSFGRLKIHSGLYDNYVINGSDTSIFGWRTDRLQLRYNGNKRFMDFVKADSSTMIYNKLILSSPNDTMLSVRGTSHFIGDVNAAGNIILENATGSNFIGTITPYHLDFRIGNSPAGYLDHIGDNTAFGYLSGSVITSGIDNVSFGIQTLLNNTTGSRNAAFGAQAMFANISGYENTAIGYSALWIDRGSYNTAVGANACRNSDSTTYNTAVGESSLLNSNNDKNTAIGAYTLPINGVGTNNIAIGYRAGNGSNSDSNKLFINSIQRANLQDDTTKSIIFGSQGAVIGNQNLWLNANTYIGGFGSAAPILTVLATDSTSTFIGNVTVADTTFMEHLEVIDSISFTDLILDQYGLAPDADSVLVADDGVINLRAGAYGELKVLVFNAGIYAERAEVIISSDGSVYLVDNSVNVTSVGGTDNNLNIYDGGTYAIIENKLGGSRTIKYWFTH